MQIASDRSALESASLGLNNKEIPMKKVLLVILATAFSTQSFAASLCTQAASQAVKTIIQMNFPGPESKGLEIRKVTVLSSSENSETLSVIYGYAGGEMRGENFETQVVMSPNTEAPGRCVLKAYETKF